MPARRREAYGAEEQVREFIGGARGGDLMAATAEHLLVDVRHFLVLGRCSTAGAPPTSTRPRRPSGRVRSSRRWTSFSAALALIHRGVYELAREATDAFESARPASPSSWAGTRPARSSPATPPRRSTWSLTRGAARTSDGRRGAHHRDGAPLEHRPVADALRGDRARLRYLTLTEGAELSLEELDSMLAEGRVKLVAFAHVSNARHDQPRRRDRPPRTGRRR